MRYFAVSDMDEILVESHDLFPIYFRLYSRLNLSASAHYCSRLLPMSKHFYLELKMKVLPTDDHTFYIGQLWRIQCWIDKCYSSEFVLLVSHKWGNTCPYGRRATWKSLNQNHAVLNSMSWYFHTKFWPAVLPWPEWLRCDFSPLSLAIF